MSERLQLKITSNLLAYLLGLTHNKRQEYEVKNALERWLLTVCQTQYPVSHDLKLLPAECNQQLEKELRDKGAIGFKLIDFLSIILEVHKYYSPPADALSAQELINTRYASLLWNGGQNWGLTQKHVDALFDKCGVRFEAFASPLNSRLMGKGDGAHFCSLFGSCPEEKQLGSLGNFFSLFERPINTQGEKKNNWYVNPPFIESLLEKAADQILHWLDNSDSSNEFTVYFLMPYWRDAKAHVKLSASRHVVRIHPLLKEKFSMQLADGSVTKSPVRCDYFVLSTSHHKEGIDLSVLSIGLCL